MQLLYLINQYSQFSLVQIHHKMYLNQFNKLSVLGNINEKTLAILLLVAPTIVFANTMQSPEQSIKTALDCKKVTNLKELEKDVKSLSSSVSNGSRGKVYKLTSPIKYGNLNGVVSENGK